MNFHDYTQFSSLHLYIHSILCSVPFFPFPSALPHSFFLVRCRFFVSQITLWYKILMQKLCSPRIKADNQPEMNEWNKNRKKWEWKTQRESQSISTSELDGKRNFFWLLLSWQRNTNDKFWKILLGCFGCHLHILFCSPHSSASLFILTLCSNSLRKFFVFCFQH